MADIPGDITTTTVMDMSLGVGTFSGALEAAGDHDFIKITLFQGVTTSFYLSFLETGSVVNGDSTIRLLDSTGAVVATNSDSGVGPNSLLTFTPGAGQGGTYFIDIGEAGDNDTGNYSLVASFPFSSPTNRLLTDGNDIFTGTTANERILGGKGADTITIGAGVDAFGEQGNDIIFGNFFANIMSGGLGADTLIGGSSGDKIMFGDSGDDVIFGGSDLDSIRGGSGDDILDGGADEDVIDGGTGSDFIHGGTGSDTIIGGGAKDFMDGDHAGTDEDVFVYAALSDSRKGNANRDVIDGFADGFFVHPDRIDLGAIDAVKGTPGNQDFAFIGQSAFSDTPGELRFEFNAAKNITLVQGDTNGDGKADIEIELTGQNTMTLDNFVL